MFNDSFYTPKILADKLIGFIDRNGFETVADFCMGDGELLRAANNKWPSVNCYGSDISEEVVQIATSNHNKWELFELDFLNDEKRLKSRLFENSRKFDLILLNPPFSCIGGTVHDLEFEGCSFKASTAMKFLVTSIQYLKDDGLLYCILPSSVAYSKKDAKIWSILEKRFNISILEQPNTKYFKDATPNVILVSLNDFTQKSKLKSVTRISLDFEKVTLFRGKLSMYEVHNHIGNIPLVHSTNLINNRLVDLDIKVNKQNSTIVGPAVLIPRVGKPLRSKPCIIGSNETYVISDCIIAIRTTSIEQASRLLNYMLSNWDLIMDLYQGTGAKYTTIDKFTKFLNLDFEASNFNNRKAI